MPAGADLASSGRSVSRSPRYTVGGFRRAQPTASASRCRRPASTGPQQALQPAHVVVAADVERVEVQARPPAHIRHPRGQRHRPPRFAAQDRRLRVTAGHMVAPVLIRVAVGQQGEPGTRADLEQRQRLREQQEAGSRVAHRAGSFVWVRRAWMTAASSLPRYAR